MSEGPVIVKINIHVSSLSDDLKAELVNLVKYVQDNPSHGLYLESYHAPDFKCVNDISMEIVDDETINRIDQ